MALTFRHGFPTLDEDESGIIITEGYFAPWADRNFERPTIGTPYNPIDSDNGFVIDDDLFLSGIRLKPNPGRENFNIDYIYRPKQQHDWENRDDGETEYTLTNGQLEKALETHPKYRTHWNYFIGSNTAGNPPSNYTDATNLSPLTNAAGDEWYWFKSLGDEPDNNATYIDPIKIGVENYILPAPVITETKYYHRKATAESNTGKVGFRKKPNDTLGQKYVDENGSEQDTTVANWLITASDMDYDGKYWRVTIEYTYADEWDGDLYKNA